MLKCLVVILIVAQVTSFPQSNGGLMCLGEGMCSGKKKSSGRKKDVEGFKFGTAWKGPFGPREKFVNFRPWYKRFRTRNNAFYRPRLELMFFQLFDKIFLEGHKGEA